MAPDADVAKPIFLTFDDGPCEPNTSQILGVLKKCNARATFFVCGRNAERCPEDVKRAASEGHAIGNHTYSHSPWLALTGRLEEGIEETSQIIERLIGRQSHLLRFPWGFGRRKIKHWAERQGYLIYSWDIAVYDWWRVPPKFIAQRVIQHARPGLIVLMHDGDQATGRGNRWHTLKALELIIPALLQQEYEFASLANS